MTDLVADLFRATINWATGFFWIVASLCVAAWWGGLACRLARARAGGTFANLMIGIAGWTLGAALTTPLLARFDDTPSHGGFWTSMPLGVVMTLGLVFALRGMRLLKPAAPPRASRSSSSP